MDDKIDEKYALILARLKSEEEDHKAIMANHAELLVRTERLEQLMEPLGELVPILEDFAATGRIGRMLAKLTIAIAGFLAAAGAIYWSVVHGFSSK